MHPFFTHGWAHHLFAELHHHATKLTNDTAVEDEVVVACTGQYSGVDVEDEVVLAQIVSHVQPTQLMFDSYGIVAVALLSATSFCLPVFAFGSHCCSLAVSGISSPTPHQCELGVQRSDLGVEAKIVDRCNTRTSTSTLLLLPGRSRDFVRLLRSSVDRA